MREVFLLNPGWRFHRGDIGLKNHEAIHATRFDEPEWIKSGNHGLAKPGYPDDGWEKVDLPHDYVVEGRFSPEANTVHGSRVTDKGWYRKTFVVPAEDDGRRIRLEFDGVYRDCQVWMNGSYVGRHLSGYTSFWFDVTDLCEFGTVNTLAVRTDATTFELWSYEGGGIYRDVRLVKTDRVHVPWCGTFVQALIGETGDDAALTVETEIRNDGYAEAVCRVRSVVLDADGVRRVELPDQEVRLAPMSGRTSVQAGPLDGARRWDIDDPYLYRVVTTLLVDGAVVDEVETSFGVRHIRFDAERGFFLNGRSLKLKGVCDHQDHAGVGVAIPERLYGWRLEQLKDMGVNALRTAHNPPSPALLEQCDRMGVLVMDETRMVGSSHEALGQLKGLIYRDRNHPSVILWSLGNEEMVVQDTRSGVRQFRRMQHLAHRLDPTRPVTYAMNCGWYEISRLHDEEGFRFDVFGANYNYTPEGVDEGKYDSFHASYPDWPLIGAETGGSMATRGLYGPEFYDGEPLCPESEALGIPAAMTLNPSREGIATAYNESVTPWGSSIQQTWRNCAERDFLAGTFLWTGFDYRGETYPYGWPSVITRFGLFDLCGFPKDAVFYYRAWWREQETTLHLFPHWTWPGRDGEVVNVWCYSNCAEVEVSLNGRSLGRKAMEPNGYLTWDIPYEPGRLEAVGYDADGHRVQDVSVETAGPPAGLRLDVDRCEIAGDGDDVAMVRVEVLDEAGRPVPTADSEVRFTVSGPGEIRGVGNGNPTSHEPDKADRRRAFNGLCQVLVGSTGDAGTLQLRAEADGLAPASVDIVAVPAARRPFIASVDRVEPGSGPPTEHNPVDGRL